MPKPLRDDARERIVRIVRRENQKEPQTLGSGYWFGPEHVLTSAHLDCPEDVGQLFVQIPIDQEGHAFHLATPPTERELAVATRGRWNGLEVLTLERAPPDLIPGCPLVASGNDVRAGRFCVHGYPAWNERSNVTPMWNGEFVLGSGGEFPHVRLAGPSDDNQWRGLSGGPVFWSDSRGQTPVLLGVVQKIARNDSTSVKAILEMIRPDADFLARVGVPEEVVQRRRAVDKWQSSVIEAASAKIEGIRAVLASSPDLWSQDPIGDPKQWETSWIGKLGPFARNADPEQAEALLDLVAAVLIGHSAVIAGLAAGAPRIHVVLSDHILLQGVAAGASGAGIEGGFQFEHAWYVTKHSRRIEDSRRLPIDLAHGGSSSLVDLLRHALQKRRDRGEMGSTAYEARNFGRVCYFQIDLSSNAGFLEPDVVAFLEETGTILVLSPPRSARSAAPPDDANTYGPLESLVMQLLDRARRQIE